MRKLVLLALALVACDDTDLGSSSSSSSSSSSTSSSSSSGEPLACTGLVADCDGDADTGCETNTAISSAHCGGCDAPCPAATGEVAVCVESACHAACKPGLADCNGEGMDGCEADLGSDTAHCGACGRACDLGCIEGVCVAETLAPSLAQPTALAFGGGRLVWLELGTVPGQANARVAALDLALPGEEPVQIAPCGGVPGRAFAVSETHVAWTTLAGGSSTIWTAALETDATPVAIATASDARGVALDDAFVYWTSGSPGVAGGSISRAPLLGGAEEPLVADVPGPLAVLARGADLLWIESGVLPALQGRLAMRPLAGGPVVELSPIADPGFLLAPATDGFFVSSREDGTLRVVPAAGGASIVLTDLGSPQHAVDDGETVFWTAAVEAVFRAPLAGGAEEKIAGEQTGPRGIAIDGTRVYWADAGTADGHDGAIRRTPR